jgi:glycosyltransferase involved in cell wall biosynthesis
MGVVLSSSYYSPNADFARIISRKFVHGRLLVIGANFQELERQFADVKRTGVVMWSPGDLMIKREQSEATASFEAGVWFYPSRENDDDRVVEALSHCAESIVLVPGPGADAARRRPRLVQRFEHFGLRPDYECDLMELDPAAVCLRHQPSSGSGELTPKVETAFARLNRALSDSKQSLQIRDLELEGAQRHIAALEEKLLKLKEYRRELKLLKEQKQTLRKSPERRVGQILLAPYRLPEKLAKTVWRKLHWPARERRRAVASSEYQEWFERHHATAQDLAQMRRESRAFLSKPLISIITPVFDTPLQRLAEAIESVLAQAYENWELVLIDDGSSDAELLRALPVLAARDRRITLKSLGKHEGISAASNQGLALAHGEWITFLDHDDVIEPDALFQIVKHLQTHPAADLIYSDEDKLGDDGFEAPLFKPDWSPDFLRSYNYLGHLTAVRRDIVQKAGGFRSQFDSAQDYDLFFRVIEQTSRIHHIPRILYHWRRSESSSAISVRQKPEQLEASRLAIEDHLNRRGEPARVTVDWRTHAFCIRRELSEPKKISVIIRSRRGLESLERCIESLTSRTSYPNYEIVVVQDNKFHDASDFSLRFPHHLLRFPGEPNDSAVKNFAVNETNDPWILFLNESIEPIEPQWLTIMAEHVQRAEVGAVGARLLNPNGTIEQAGTVVGVNNTAQSAFRAFPAEHPGANRQLQVTRNCSAVSSACMLTRRDVFQQAGGFDESLGEMFADVDLCLKMRRAGHLIVYTPFAKLCWREAPSGEIDVEGEAAMHERWADVLRSDPYYNPNLSRERADFSLGKLNIG